MRCSEPGGGVAVAIVASVRRVAELGSLDRTRERMQIGYLADHRHFVPALARWHYDEWSYLRPEESLESRTARLGGYCGHREIPTVLVAFGDCTLFGSAMLVPHDMETRMEWSPWLAGVFVVPDHRRLGVGTALVESVVADAAGLGVARLYLYTPSAEVLYSRLGWSIIERTQYRGADVSVMSYECAV
jgi:GNAT superfamily N-acetyltransferase